MQKKITLHFCKMIFPLFETSKKQISKNIQFSVISQRKRLPVFCR